MSAEYSVRKNAFTADGGTHKVARILDVADGLRRIGEFESAEMLTAYAERIKADERAVPVAWQFKRRPEDYPDEWSQCSKEHYDACSRRKDSPLVYRELFNRPPAQTAQVSNDVLLHRATWIADMTSDPTLGLTPNENTRIHRFACEIRDALIALKLREPAAQGEVDELIAAYDDAVRSERESGFLPPLAQQAARDCVSHNRSRLRKALAAQPRAVPDVAAMVNRFLGWRLPDDFYPDGGISFTHVTNPSWTHDSWPIGTNLFTAAQAEQMFRYVLAVPASQAPIYCCTHCKLPNHDGIDHADCEDAAASRAMLAAAPSPGESK